jgi:hypothetical protein
MVEVDYLLGNFFVNLVTVHQLKKTLFYMCLYE